MALCIPAVVESYDCTKDAISLERSNSFQGLCPNSPDPLSLAEGGVWAQDYNKYSSTIESLHYWPCFLGLYQMGAVTGSTEDSMGV